MIQLMGRSILQLSSNELSYLFSKHDPPDTENEPVEEEPGDEEADGNEEVAQ